MTLKKNDIVNLTITSATAEGSGVGRTDDGIAVFVQGSAIGDELNVRILKVKKTYAFGKIEEILVPSKARITPDCENFMKCGGCTWRHISYGEECKIKQQRVEDAVTRIGGLDNVVFKPIISSDNITRYRNKAQYPVGLDRDGNVVTGFYSFHSHRIINCTDCILQPEIFARVIEITKDFIAKLTRKFMMKQQAREDFATFISELARFRASLWCAMLSTQTVLNRKIYS